MRARSSLFLAAGWLAALGLWWSAPGAAGAEHTVLLSGITFKPSRLKAAKGDTIKFINKDPFNHDVYLVRAANRNIVIQPATTLKAGQSVTLTIKEGGLFNLYCTIHGGMSGKISTTGSFELSAAEKKKYYKVKVIPPIVKVGEKLFWGRAQCFHCHQIGKRGKGLRGPNLQDIGFRAKVRARKLKLDSASAYITQSVMEPPAYVVEGYSNDMPRVYLPPIGLNEHQLKAVIAYLQSQGGDVDTWSIAISKQKMALAPPPDPFRHGDPKRGQAVFKKAGCNSCHTVGDQKAISIGPELTEIGAYRDWTWLAESIVAPNAEIGHNWQDAIVYFKDDADTDMPFAAGVIRKNVPDEVQMLVGRDRVQSFPRKIIERVKLLKKSRMPTDFPKKLTFSEMADLVRYLESLKGPAKKTAPAPPAPPAP